MATPRFAWGIDIGNRALKAVKLVPGAEGLVIDDFDIVEHETVLSAAGDNRDSLVQTALATFVSRHSGIDKGLVGIGVPGKSAFAKFVPLPPVEKKKIPEIVRFEAMQQIPFPLDDVEWSYQLFEDPGSPDVEVGIFAMRRELVNQQIKFFTDAKLNVQVVQMNPLAVYNAMYYDNRVKGTTMIVDLGAENTDLIIAEGETVWLRSISIGGNQFTEALTKAFKVPFDKAEELKRNASTSKYGRQIMQAMRPIFSDLVSEIQRSIGFYSSVHKESRVSRVVALGSTFRLPGLQKYLEQNLSMPVEKLTGLSTGALEDPKAGALFSDNMLSAAGAYGLALQVMGQGKISSNLLPAEIRKEKMWKEKNKWFAAAAAMIVLGAAVGYGRQYYESTQSSSVENDTARSNINALIQTATRQKAAWMKVQTDGPDARQRILNVESLKADRDLWPQIDDAIFSALPQNAKGAPAALTSGDISELKKIKRSDRNQIVIESMVSHYYPDLNDIINKTNPSGGSVLIDKAKNEEASPRGLPTGTNPVQSGGDENYSGGPPPAGQPGGNNQPAPRRGFIITMRVLTPQSKTNIIDAMNNALVAQGVTAGHPFEFAEVRIAKRVLRADRQRDLYDAWKERETEKAKEAPLEPGAMPVPGGGGGDTTPSPTPQQGGGGGGGSAADRARAYEGGGSFGGGGGRMRGGGAGSQAVPGMSAPIASGEHIPPEAYMDPVLNEDAQDDTECYIVAAVVIDPPAKPAPAGGAPGKTVAVAH
jgi:type IV pilus assembly protein PilM